MPHVLRFSPGGSIACLHTEEIDLAALGRLDVVRASEIAFNVETQCWDTREARTGNLLFSHPSRTACLRWEHENLQPGSPGFENYYQSSNS